MIEYGHPIFILNSSTQMTVEQARKAFSMIRKECCNYESGNCKMLADDENSRCRQLKTESVVCSWFREAILPMDKVLETSICNSEGSENTKKCVECGKEFIPRNNKQKYCIKCIPKVIKKQNSLRQQKRRSLSRNRGTL